MAVAAKPESTRVVSIRISPKVERDIEAIAERDANTLSATTRRLVMAGLRAERRSIDSDNEAA